MSNKCNDTIVSCFNYSLFMRLAMHVNVVYNLNRIFVVSRKSMMTKEPKDCSHVLIIIFVLSFIHL